MQIVITNYDNSCGEQVMIGKKFYKLHTEALQDAIYMRDEYIIIAGILKSERAAGILDGYEIKEVTSFESTY